jgi:hypothetical protein
MLQAPDCHHAEPIISVSQDAGSDIAEDVYRQRRSKLRRRDTAPSDLCKV